MSRQSAGLRQKNFPKYRCHYVNFLQAEPEHHLKTLDTRLVVFWRAKAQGQIRLSDGGWESRSRIEGVRNPMYVTGLLEKQLEKKNETNLLGELRWAFCLLLQALRIRVYMRSLVNMTTFRLLFRILHYFQTVPPGKNVTRPANRPSKKICLF